jgi:hypothetical protein
LEPIPLTRETFTGRIRGILGNPLDLKIETWKDNPFTIVYLSSITNTGELQNHILGPISLRDYHRSENPTDEWDWLLPLARGFFFRSGM